MRPDPASREPAFEGVSATATASGRRWAIPPRDELRHRYLVPFVVTCVLVVLVVVGKITTPGFLAADNLLDVVRAASFTGIAALGLTFITISGNYFSLSTEQTAAFAAITFAAVLSSTGSWLLAVVAALAVAVVIGVVQGLLVAAGANPIVTTLAGGAALFGLAATLTSSHAVIIRTSSADWIGTARPLGIPTQTWTFIVMTILAAFVLNRTRIGRTITLAGANARAATAVGLKVGRATVLAFTLASVTAAIAGIFVAAQSHRGLVEQVPGLTLDAVAAVLVGGTAVQGGEGSMIRTTLGAIFIVLLQNLVIVRGYSYGIQVLVVGVAVMLTVGLFWIARGGRR